MSMKHFIGLCWWSMLVCPVLGQEDKLPWVKLSVEPAAAPVPALKYPLLPEVRDLKPGNAALLYQRAHAPEWFSAYLRHPDYAQASEWLDWPLEKFPRDKVRKLLPGSALQEVDLAARRAFCDWEMTERIRQDGPSLQIPDVQGFRHYGFLLALRARLEMLDKKYDKVVYTMQTGYALSRHVSEQPILISSLVGLAIATLVTREMENLIQQPEGPNLYWALTDLPQPFIDLRPAFQGERLMVEGLMPEIRQALNDPSRPPLSPAQIGAMVDRLANMMGQADKGPNLAARLQAGVAATLLYKEARQYLVDQGFPAQKLEPLPSTQVALMFALAEYDQIYDDMVKWQNLPYDRALEGMRAAEARCRLRPGRSAWSSLSSLLAPAVTRVKLAQLRFDRRLAALRIVEALRLYAAAHQGQLPVSLDDLRDLAVPADPLTGKAFGYRREGERAWLSGPPPSIEPAQTNNTIRYEITLRRK